VFVLVHSRASNACHSVSDSVEIVPFWIAQFRRVLDPKYVGQFYTLESFCHFVLRKSELRKSAFARFAPSKSASLRFAPVVGILQSRVSQGVSKIGIAENFQTPNLHTASARR